MARTNETFPACETCGADAGELCGKGCPSEATRGTSTREAYVCETCGSENVLFDAWARWDSTTRTFELSSTLDMTSCEDCENECKVKQVMLDA